MVTTNERGKRRLGRPPKAEAGDTKAALREAALRLFAQKGYAGTSTRAIAREVGLSESVLYSHFGSKRAIFEAVMAEYGPEGATSLLDTLDPGLAEDDPPEFVRLLVARLFDAWDNPDARLLMSLMAQDGLTHDPYLIEGIQCVVEQVGRQFAHWIEAGWIQADLGAPDDLAFALIAPIGQLRVRWLHADATSKARRAARDQAHRHADLLVKAVFPTR